MNRQPGNPFLDPPPAMLPARGEFVVRDAYVMTMDPALGDLAEADVHVRDGEIVAVGAGLMAPEAESIEGCGRIVLPGFVDTHWHMWTTLFRSLAGDSPERGYFPLKTALGKVYSPLEMVRAVRLAAAEALHAGITTVHDWCHNVRGPSFADADLRALAESGIRARFSYGYTEDLALDRCIDLEDLRRVKQEWFAPSGQSLLSLGAALRGFACPPQTCRREWEAARALGLPITVHADASPRRPPHRQIEAMFAEGMLGKDVQVVHANSATPAAIEHLAATGTSVSLSPVTEMRVGFGFPLTGELLGAGVRVGLSIDTVALAGDANMFAVMKATQTVANARAGSECHLTARCVLELATIDGARSLDLGDRVGSLIPGKRADLILVRMTDLNCAPFTDPVHLLVEAAQPGNVEMVIVDGRILKRDGKLTAVDVERVVAEAGESLSVLRRRAGWL
jgi:5-methylthioadenosine/S-adenosylhomocysteine deaminase